MINKIYIEGCKVFQDSNQKEIYLNVHSIYIFIVSFCKLDD